ncbi:MAG: hypothetical protein PSV26_01115 [Polaromonas sp.]|uniref:hypothetical protein n=1 Tax=Polaromonas sp. TaxID=1869339 RepID=UPI002488633C|nr:hypothetical protein [Polaromonas sp.]MDI1236064.1 hypothetical protein [Polaromonas sp.]
MILPQLEKHFPGNHPRTIAVREHIYKAVVEFVDSGLADPKFVRELTSNSDQKFWACVSEALIAARLRGKQFGKRKTIGAGPDFLVMDGSRKVWIEVICPEPINVPSDWLNPKSGETITFPHEAILLRWASAIKAKSERLVGSDDGIRASYLKSGVVDPEDAYVIAVNGCRLRSGPFPALLGISQFPFAAEAVFPVGPYQLRIDRDTLKVVDRGHQHRPFVLNQNRAKVPALLFLDPRFNAVSAIWALDFNGGSAIGNSEPSAVVHNPNALNPLPIGFLPADKEYAAIPKGNELVLSTVSASAANTG